MKKRDKIFGMMFAVVVALVMMLAGSHGRRRMAAGDLENGYGQIGTGRDE